MRFGVAEQRLRSAVRLFSPFPKLPVYAIVYVTSRCDARCRHCFFWEELNTVRKEMTLDEFEGLAGSMGPLLQLTLTGGSPELRRDLPAIAEVFFRRCRPMNLTVCMLGYHTDRIRRHVEAILESCPGQNLTIGLSLDGIGDEHDELRGMPGLFVRLVDTFRSLAELRSRYPNLYVNAGVTITALNHRTALRTARWAWENLAFDDLKPILVRGDNTRDPEAWDRACFDGYVEVLEEARARLRDRPGRTGLFARAVRTKELVQRQVIRQIFTTGKSPVVCSAARETAVIWPNGDAAGCEMRPGALGNLRDVGMDFPALWFNEAAAAFRSSVNRVDACKGCYHHCFISPAIFRTPRMWWRMARSAWEVGRGA